LRKSQLYINALIKIQTKQIHSVEDFTEAFNPALSYYSPIGQDEVVSYFIGGVLADLINQQTNPQVIEVLMKDSEQWTDPIIRAGKGFGYSQNLYNFAALYQLAAQKLKNADYFQKSFELFFKGLENSPNREIFLNGLFNNYQIAGDKAKAKEIGEIILKYWPGERRYKKSD